MINADFYTKEVSTEGNTSVFQIEPLPYSFGHSLGNALRRTLLSSLEGFAITQIYIKEAPHMFSPIPGVKESALELILNLKQLRFGGSNPGSYHISLTKKGPGVITGADIKGDLEVANPDLYIGEVTSKDGIVSIEFYVEHGVGYIPSEEVEKKSSEYTTVDAFFSPIKRVTYTVEEARVGRKANADKLLITIETDGSIDAKEALMRGVETFKAITEHLLLDREEAPKLAKEVPTAKKQQESSDKKLEEVIIDELDLPSRVTNALLREKIETVKDLLAVDKDVLANMKGLGKKSVALIEEELQKLGLSFN